MTSTLLLAGACLAASPSSEELYGRMVARTSGITAIKGNLQAYVGSEVAHTSFELARPSFYKLISETSQAYGEGSQLVIYFPDRHEYIKQEVNPNTRVLPVVGLENVFLPGVKYYSPVGRPRKVEFHGDRVWQITVKNSNSSLDLFINAENFMPEGSARTVPTGQIVEWLSGMVSTRSFDKRKFLWMPPKGAHDASLQANAMHLLKVGETAPNFMLKDAKGQVYQLSDVLRKHRATLISFWFYGCTGCRSELPNIVRIYNKNKDRGLEVLGVNIADPDYRISAFRQEFSIGYPLLGGGGIVAEQYGVISCPTNYLIGRDGAILAAIAGYDGGDAELRNAIEKLGFAW